MKLLITGAAGQLGTELLRQLENGGSVLGPVPAALQGAAVVAVDLPDADLTDLAQAQALLEKHRPDAVINCAAFTNVDAAETEQDAAFAANAVAPRNMAMACQAVGAKLVHISTDYVFGATPGTQPHSEAAEAHPTGVYGTTKYLGEQYVRQFCSRWFIVRASWLYGRKGGNFVRTILRLASENDTLKVVNDQFGNPTNAEDLAHHLLKLAASEEYGLYHCSGNGVCSWFDFASEIVRLAGKSAKVLPCTTEEFPRPAPRPPYSPMDHAMLRATVGDEMRPWQEAIRQYIEELGANT